MLYYIFIKQDKQGFFIVAHSRAFARKTEGIDMEHKVEMKKARRNYFWSQQRVGRAIASRHAGSIARSIELWKEAIERWHDAETVQIQMLRNLEA